MPLLFSLRDYLEICFDFHLWVSFISGEMNDSERANRKTPCRWLDWNVAQEKSQSPVNLSTR